MTADRLSRVLSAIGLEVSARDLAEVIWLACHLTVAEGDAGAGLGGSELAVSLNPPGSPDKSGPADRAGGGEGLYAGASAAGALLDAQASQVPTAPMLPDVLAIQRVLRPLKRRVPAGRVDVLDEELTAQRIADQLRQRQLWIPVMRPSSERWLSLALVVDTGPSMEIWQPLARELQEALAQLGAFREVSTWYLHGHQIAVVSGGPRFDPAALIDPSGRQACLVLSDCSGRYWWDGRSPRALHLWAQNGPTAILQPLAERLWRRSAVPPIPGVAQARRAGAPNSELRFIPHDASHWPGLPVPVMEISPRWLAGWARLVAGPANLSLPMAACYPSAVPANRAEPLQREGELPIRERVRRFQATASRQAARLAAYTAVSVPTLPVMRLVQRRLLRDPQPGHLAEVLLSGLLRPVAGQPGAYEFIPGARQELLATLPRSESWYVADALARISAEIESRVDRPGDVFRAYLLVPAGTGDHALGAGQPFALVSEDALHHSPRDTGTTVPQQEAPQRGPLPYEPLPYEAPGDPSASEPLTTGERLAVPGLLAHVFLVADSQGASAGWDRLRSLWDDVTSSFGLDRAISEFEVPAQLSPQNALPPDEYRLLAAAESEADAIWQALAWTDHNLLCVTVMMAPSRTMDCALAWSSLERRWDRVVSRIPPVGVIGEARLLLALLAAEDAEARPRDDDAMIAQMLELARAAVAANRKPSADGWWRHWDTLRLGSASEPVPVWEIGPESAAGRPTRRLAVVAPEKLEREVDTFLWTHGDGVPTSLTRHLMHAARLRHQVRVFDDGKASASLRRELSSLTDKGSRQSGALESGDLAASLTRAQAAAIALRARMDTMRTAVGVIDRNMMQAIDQIATDVAVGPLSDDHQLALWLHQRLDREIAMLDSATENARQAVRGGLVAVGTTLTEPVKWPGPSDYLEVIQTPRLVFADPKLHAARFETSHLGIPSAVTGRSAVVFRAVIGEEAMAIRCFTRQTTAEQRYRYQQLHTHLAPDWPSYFVSFAYQEDAILVAGTWYPLVLMGWAPGVPLNIWIAGNLKRGDELRKSANNWLEISKDMNSRSLAHGSLDNGSCLVSQSGITLVGYDSCFIPQLASVPPSLAVHHNFAHPDGLEYYGVGMDRFPSLVIYVSLLALASDNSLWSRYNTHDNLIFTGRDYRAPNETEIWLDLARSNDRRVRYLSGALAKLCEAPVSSLPPLNDVVTNKRLP